MASAISYECSNSREEPSKRQVLFSSGWIVALLPLGEKAISGWCLSWDSNGGAADQQRLLTITIILINRTHKATMQLLQRFPSGFAIKWEP